MTTITIKHGQPLPQTTFNNWEELRKILNFMSIEFKETGKNIDNNFDKPLSEFNYLTDESLRN